MASLGAQQQGGGMHGVNAGTLQYPPPSTGSSRELPDMVLRLLAALTTFLAAVVMGATKQTFVDEDEGSSVQYKTTGEGKSQLSFVIAANTIACFYSLVSLAMTVVRKGPSVKAVIAMVDLIMVGFLFAAVGSGAAMSVFFHGSVLNICKAAAKYCRGVAAAVAMSTFGATAFLLLVILVLLAMARG